MKYLKILMFVLLGLSVDCYSMQTPEKATQQSKKGEKRKHDDGEGAQDASSSKKSKQSDERSGKDEKSDEAQSVDQKTEDDFARHMFKEIAACTLDENHVPNLDLSKMSVAVLKKLFKMWQDEDQKEMARFANDLRKNDPKLQKAEKLLGKALLEHARVKSKIKIGIKIGMMNSLMQKNSSAEQQRRGQLGYEDVKLIIKAARLGQKDIVIAFIVEEYDDFIGAASLTSWADEKALKTYNDSLAARLQQNQKALDAALNADNTVSQKDIDAVNKELESYDFPKLMSEKTNIVCALIKSNKQLQEKARAVNAKTKELTQS